MSDENTADGTPKTSGDLRDILKQFAQPVLDSLDTRLRDQIDTRVDARVDAILSDRLAVLERAVADLDRAVRALQERLDRDDADHGADEAAN